MTEFYGIRTGTIPGFAEAGGGTFMSVQGLPDRTVQNILASGADRIALPDASAPSPRLPVHPNIRGRAYYTGEETTPCWLTPPSTN